jgi:transcriptional regulator with XRE-family HTH domain
MAMATFNERLKALREKAKLTQEELARAAGLGVDTIRKLEQTNADPKLTTFIALVRALGVGLDDLAGVKTPKGKRS